MRDRCLKRDNDEAHYWNLSIQFKGMHKAIDA